MNKPTQYDDMPPEIDFSKGVQGLHHIAPEATVFMPASIERGVWEYFSGKAELRGIELSAHSTAREKLKVQISQNVYAGDLLIGTVVIRDQLTNDLPALVYCKAKMLGGVLCLEGHKRSECGKGALVPGRCPLLHFETEI